MLWNFVLIALVWAVAEFSWGVEYPEVYAVLTKYLNEHELSLSGSVVGGAAVLVVCSYVFRALGWYSLVFLVSKVSFHVSQFAVCAVSYAAVAFWFYVSKNLWADIGYGVVAIPFISLFASSFSLWIFDFNYPVAERIYNNILVAIVSMVLVLIMSFVGITF